VLRFTGARARRRCGPDRSPWSRMAQEERVAGRHRERRSMGMPSTPPRVKCAGCARRARLARQTTRTPCVPKLFVEPRESRIVAFASERDQRHPAATSDAATRSQGRDGPMRKSPRPRRERSRSPGGLLGERRAASATFERSIAAVSAELAKRGSNEERDRAGLSLPFGKTRETLFPRSPPRARQQSGQRARHPSERAQARSGSGASRRAQAARSRARRSSGAAEPSNVRPRGDRAKRSWAHAARDVGRSALTRKPSPSAEDSVGLAQAGSTIRSARSCESCRHRCGAAALPKAGRAQRRRSGSGHGRRRGR